MSLDGAIDATGRDATASDILADITSPDAIPADVTSPDAIPADVTSPDAIPADVTPQVDAPKLLFGDDFQDGKLDPGAWQYWSVSFAEKSGRLSVLPQARPGFNYGHSGNGRNAEVLTHVGDQTWTDYRLEVELSATGIDNAFNPYSLPSATRRRRSSSKSPMQKRAGTPLRRQGINFPSNSRPAKRPPSEPIA